MNYTILKAGLILLFCYFSNASFAQNKSEILLKDDKGNQFAGKAGESSQGVVDGSVEKNAILKLEVNAKKAQVKIDNIEIWHYRGKELLDFKRVNYNEAQTPHTLDLSIFVPTTQKADYVGIQVELSDKTKRQFGLWLK